MNVNAQVLSGRLPLSPSYRVLLVEDEPEILEDLRHELDNGLSKLKSEALPSVGAYPRFTLETSIRAVDNIADARHLVQSETYDLVLADYKIKKTASDAKGTASIMPLLKEIKARNGLLPALGHTAFLDMLEFADESGIALKTFNKADRDSVGKLVSEGLRVSEEMMAYKTSLFTAFSHLIGAVNSDSPIDSQFALDEARACFAAIGLPRYASDDYKRTLVVVTAMLHRISSVPSRVFGIGALSPILLEHILPLVQSLGKPFHSYRANAIPAFKKLELAGYEVIMRVQND